MDAAAKLEMLDWLKNELSASNDIIGILLHRLRSLGDPGEYYQLFAAVEKRRQLWEPIIHPDFFPRYGIDDELQQSLSGRRPPPPYPLQHIVLSPPSPSPRRPPPAQSLNHRAFIPPSPPPHRPPPVQPLNHRDLLPPSPSPRPSSFVPSHHGHNANHRSDPSRPAGKIVASTPMLYTTREIIDGKPVNTVEGLKVYEELIDVTQIQKILSFANEKRDNFRRAGLTVGQTVILNKRPLRCHGSLSIQLGAPIVEGHIQDKNQRETRVEAVPGFVQDLFDRFFQQGIVPSKPDYCVIDFYLEGEYCRPHQYPPWYGRPLCTLCLTECDMVCGGVIRGERGDARGPLQLSLSRGSLVVLQERSADVAQRCIPASNKQRVLLTFGKSLPREFPEPTAEPCPVPRSDGMHRHAISSVPVAAAAIPFPAAVPLATTACSCLREASPRPVTHRLPGLPSSYVRSSTSTIV